MPVHQCLHFRTSLLVAALHLEHDPRWSKFLWICGLVQDALCRHCKRSLGPTHTLGTYSQLCTLSMISCTPGVTYHAYPPCCHVIRYHMSGLAPLHVLNGVRTSRFSLRGPTEATSHPLRHKHRGSRFRSRRASLLLLHKSLPFPPSSFLHSSSLTPLTAYLTLLVPTCLLKASGHKPSIESSLLRDACLSSHSCIDGLGLRRVHCSSSLAHAAQQRHSICP